MLQIGRTPEVSAVMLNNHKPTLTYSPYHLPRREAALLDSFVRIINNHTYHHWELRSNVPMTETDLPVLYDTQPCLALLDVTRPCLLVGKQPRTIEGGHCLYLSLPLRSDRLEQCLNHLGLRLLGQTHTATELDSQFPLPAFGRMLQLQHWPPQRLLASKLQLRLATLLVRQPMTLDTLSKLSGQPWEDCAVFVDLLEQHGLLHDSPPAPPRPDRKNTGLLARIRRSLGLESTPRPTTRPQRMR